MNVSPIKLGLFAAYDSGVPNNKDDYFTLVILHGFAWHSGIFSRFFPLAGKHNTRIILVNRRDYPDSVPFTEEELSDISPLKLEAPGEGASLILQNYARERAKELYDFLEVVVVKEKIPKNKGLTIAGWSFGTVWITAFLAYASSFPVGKVRLAPYIRRLVAYDPPYHAFGYPPPDVFYNPLFDPSLTPGEGVKLFPSWVSGYYQHGESASSLEHRVSSQDIIPTIERLSAEDVASALYPPPANPGGSDAIFMDSGIKYGLFSLLRKLALFPKEPVNEHEEDWNKIELRYLWCDRSVWEMPWGAWALQAEISNTVEPEPGHQKRPIHMIRVTGANHFAHWDDSERALHAMISDDLDKIDSLRSSL